MSCSNVPDRTSSLVVILFSIFLVFSSSWKGPINVYSFYYSYTYINGFTHEKYNLCSFFRTRTYLLPPYRQLFNYKIFTKYSFKLISQVHKYEKPVKKKLIPSIRVTFLPCFKHELEYTSIVILVE